MCRLGTRGRASTGVEFKMRPAATLISPHPDSGIITFHLCGAFCAGLLLEEETGDGFSSKSMHVMLKKSSRSAETVWSKSLRGKMHRRRPAECLQKEIEDIHLK